MADKYTRGEINIMKYEIVTVPTRIFTERDDIIEAIKEYGKGKYGPDDLLCVAESVISITQGGAKRCEDFKPGLLAKTLCHFFPTNGAISGWYCMQALIDAEGAATVIKAFLLGSITKLFGISGVFYKNAGYQGRLIDDITGTCPPFDKHIVYGPENPFRVSKAIKEAIGTYGVCIADVNDLKRSAVIGYTEGVNPDEVARILIDNPFGNDRQKTPICVIKDYGKGRKA